MRIVFLIDDFLPEKATSSGLLTLRLARALQQRGEDVSVIAAVQHRGAAGIDERAGLPVHRVYTDYHERWRGYLSLYNPRAAGQVKKILSTIKPDVVHAQHIHYYLSYDCLRAARQSARAVFMTTHDAMLFSYGKVRVRNGTCCYRMGPKDRMRQAGKRFNPLREIIIRSYLRSADKIFSVSDALKTVLAVNGISNVVTVHNGIDTALWESGGGEEPFRQPGIAGRKIILFSGRLSGAKGGEQIVRALRPVLEKVPEAVLLIAAEKNRYADEMQDLARELSVGDSLRFAGWLTQAQMAAAYHAADVVVVPSVCLDCFPTVILEAMASRKPVVATCFGGSPEMVADHVTGYVVNPLNIGLMTDRIVDLLTDPDKAARFGQAGYERARAHFSLEAQAKQTLSWYRRIIQGQTPE